LLANQDSILAWDTSDHTNLNLDDVPTANIRRKRLYHQMAIINGGLMRRGVHIIEHPTCMGDGIHTISRPRQKLHGPYTGLNQLHL
jgi:hypothetical protein